MLARKTKACRNISHNKPFSSSGTTRTGRRIGKTSMNSTHHTPFRGAYPVGHGGSSGKYVKSIVNECCAGTKSNAQSTMTTSGLFLSRVKHPTSVYNSMCNCNTAKPIYMDTSPLNHSSESYTTTIVSRQMRTCNVHNKDSGKLNCTKYCKAASYHIGGRKVMFEPYTKEVAPISSSEYMKTKLAHKTCT
jgi:hypothetical protein